MKKNFFLLGIFLSGLVLGGCREQEKAKVWEYRFDRPARVWEETIPLGNGRIGLMPDGGVDRETFVLNEISMWSGSVDDTGNPDAYPYLAKIRELLFAGKNDEAQRMMYDHFVCKGQGSAYGNGADARYGSYQIFGNLGIQYAYPSADTCSAYNRALSLNDAVATCTFRKDGVSFTREAFTSFADDIGVIRLTADKKKQLNFTLDIRRPERYAVTTEGNDLLMRGRLNNGIDGNGTQYAARIRVVLPGDGTVSATDSTVSVADATSALVLVSLATDYFGRNPDEETVRLLDAADGKSFDRMKSEHLAAYRERFDRVDLDLGENPNPELPIDRRLEAAWKEKNDPDLMALYFQFGRYLLISSTRPGLLPPNLQGLWCNTIRTPWNGDYHLNINLQMNLWPAEPANLSELHLPLAEWTKSIVPSGEQTARTFYNARGWVTHVIGNVWQYTAPGEHPSWGATNTSAAWLCQHLYDHFLFTRDTAYLRDVYPAMKGASLFFVDMLVEDPRNGYLVTAPTTSPENSYRMPSGKAVSVSAGSTMDNQIVREVFTHTMDAARILGIDADFAGVLDSKRAKLMPTTIASDGRIMEWLEEYPEAEPTHRHVSHLYGLYPGTEISLVKTPELAEAARRTLEARGDRSTGWSMAWKVNFWARLHDGNRAAKLLSDLLRPCNTRAVNYGSGSGTYPNLFCAHPPFQIDGNFGGCAGIAEMLVQSHAGVIELLPALPDAWKTGSFRGLKVRGNGEVALKWEEGAVREMKLSAGASDTFRVKIPFGAVTLSLRVDGKKQPVELDGDVLLLKLDRGQQAVVNFELMSEHS